MNEHEGRVLPEGSGAWHEVETGGGRLRVRFVVPGERVRVRERGEDPGFADLVEILQPSAHRREPACPHFGPCGGCQLLHCAEAFQLGQRRRRAELAFAAAGVAAPPLRVVPAPAGLGHRSRARFQAELGGDGRLRLGFHATAGRRVLDLPACPLLAPELASAWQRIRAALAEARPAGLTGLEVTALPGSEEVLVLLNPRDRPPDPWPGLGERLLAAGAATGVAVRAGSAPESVGSGAALGRTPGGRPIAAALGGFVQASAAGADALCDALVGMAEPEGRRVLELHAGAGLLSHALASAGGEVRGFELDARSVEAARLLPRPARGSLELAALDAAAAFEREREWAEVLATDPPRSGLGPLAESIAERGPERIAGAWCSLDGLERDLRALRGAYRVTDAAVLDLFPQTRHCEVVARLERR